MHHGTPEVGGGGAEVRRCRSTKASASDGAALSVPRCGGRYWVYSSCHNLQK